MFDYSPGDLFRLTEFVRHSTVARTSSVAGLARDPSTLRGSTVAAGAGAGVGDLNNNRYYRYPSRPGRRRSDWTTRRPAALTPLAAAGWRSATIQALGLGRGLVP